MPEQPRRCDDRRPASPWRRALGVAVLTVTAGGAGCGHRPAQPVTADPATPAPSPRRMADCAGDTDLPQIHLLYVLPSDGADLDLDKNGLIRASVESAQTWLEGESGGSRLRFAGTLW